MKQFLIILLSLLCLGGCSAQPRSLSHGPVEMGGWLAYWDTKQGLEDFSEAKKMKSVSIFAGCLDENDELYLQDMMLDYDTDNKLTVNEAQKQLRKKGADSVYLCFVNDIKPKNNKHKDKLKDVEVLHRVFENDESMESHADRMIELTKENGCDGIELDYEKVWRDKSIVNQYLQFTYKLQTKAAKENLKVRIVLEPSADMGADFCKGPEYVVMLYNLYGTHGGPGPKADYSFIEKTIKNMEQLPENRAVAFSTGGCVWSDKEKAKFIDQVTALDMQTAAGVKPERDNESGALHFQYDDKKKGKTQVWYADSETLTGWIAESDRNGINKVYLWRLGGNDDIGEVK